MIEHARRIVERAGDEQHEQDHELGHGDLRLLLRRGSPAHGRAARGAANVAGFSSDPSCPRFPSVASTRGEPPAVRDETFNQAAASIPVYSTARATFASTAPAA